MTQKAGLHHLDAGNSNCDVEDQSKCPPPEHKKVVEDRSEAQSVSSKMRLRKPSRESSSNSQSKGGGIAILLRVAEAEYPDRDPDFRSRLAGSAMRSHGNRPSSRVSKSPSSSAPSAATTSRLNVRRSSRRPPSGIFDVGGRRWRHRRPIGRADVIRNAIYSEAGENRERVATSQKRSGLSDVASSVLGEENPIVHPGFVNRPGFNHQQRFRVGGYSVASSRSVMSSIVDDITPNDAADADDPGRGNIFLQAHHLQEKKRNSEMLDRGSSSWFLSMLDLAKPTDESRRVLQTAVPLSIGATSEAVFRLVTASFISQYLGAESMIAYLLVMLFVRLTSEELSGAIVDALSSFLESSLFSRDENAAFMSGQYTQTAIILQLILGIPLLAAWAMSMNTVVGWLVQSASIAAIAEEYTRIAIFGYVFQSISRSFTAVFHICGHEHFESVIDIVASTLQMVAIACVVALKRNSTLTTVAHIQVLVGFCACVAKVGYPIFKGWEKPFRGGLIRNFALFQNPILFWYLLRAVFPLLIGTLLEYGEWEVLTIVLRYLGPAEVATWCLLGAVWDVLEAFTEGIGEAAAIQVAFLLAAAQPERARKLSFSILYLGLVQSLLITSALFMSGRHLAMLLTTDNTMQHMVNDAITLLGFANVAMSFSQVGWSLIGAQGRFRLATSVMFFSRWLVTIPVALVTIFVFFLDLSAISGCLIVGYSTASCVLTFIVIRSDWDRLANLMQQMNNASEKEELDFEFDDSDDSSDGFGDMDSENSSEQATEVAQQTTG
eukprot:CAMPEP_0113619750 /NCGR_PEP_ID=MMETSP0017_2-20120614/10041_1 /TAXON_ID=2856 /ORGANISM="Cylindrotheca closterium" /LENGTH=777 /DNA_ID=CAMNT_0000529355 /DNA_START=205 /DNA_END=2538 /DNA_ORIENTATION=- /assembly_acc=CAM_ASM_000147